MLTDYWRLKHSADYEAVDVLVDFDETVRRAGLTDKQAQALRLVFLDGLTQDEAAERLGLASKSGVNNLLQRGIEALAAANGWGGEDVFAEWARAWYGKERLNDEKTTR